jgi:hypothetical protein
MKMLSFENIFLHIMESIVSSFYNKVKNKEVKNIIKKEKKQQTKKK